MKKKRKTKENQLKTKKRKENNIKENKTELIERGDPTWVSEGIESNN